MTKTITIQDLKVGTEIYYHGDQANLAGFGKITSNNGRTMEITMLDGRVMKAIQACFFSNEYKGNGSTSFVTAEAYNEYRKDLVGA